MARALSPLLGAALAALSLGACNASGMRVFNLGELHTDDGYHRYSAVQLSSWDWTLRHEMGGIFSDTRMHLQEVRPSDVDDPNEACLEHLVELGRHTGEGGYARSQRIATYAQYIVQCPWKLSRERCAILLGREGAALALSEHPVPRLSQTPAGPEDVAVCVSALIAAVRPLIEGRPDAFRPDELGAACDALAELSLDLDGARRALQLVALLERRTSSKDERLAPLREINLTLQRLTVSRALIRALTDRLPFERQGSNPGWGDARVRGAAVQAWVQAGGTLALADFLQQLDPREEIEIDVLLAILRSVAQVGLPAGIPGVSPADVRRLEERWIEALMRYALDHPDGRVRVAAMRALSRLAGGELASLREEDWLDWLEARRAAAVEVPGP
ncbi:MAG TPA: hypothetical protein VMT18_06130 [Planctomycetota bacterium]|nr:hypothetical protein [Planctomycetota bacterium]